MPSTSLDTFGLYGGTLNKFVCPYGVLEIWLCHCWWSIVVWFAQDRCSVV